MFTFQTCEFGIYFTASEHFSILLIFYSLYCVLIFNFMNIIQFFIIRLIFTSCVVKQCHQVLWTWWRRWRLWWWWYWWQVCHNHVIHVHLIRDTKLEPSLFFCTFYSASIIYPIFLAFLYRYLPSYTEPYSMWIYYLLYSFNIFKIYCNTLVIVYLTYSTVFLEFFLHLLSSDILRVRWNVCFPRVQIKN